ncbi:MAG: hypothetical protein JJU00_07615 [Opitutales bacterium]|nr:hypothetical protein [Opitutales bacterium]
MSGAAAILQRLRPTPLALTAILGGTAVHALAIVLVRVPDPAPAPAAPAPFVRWAEDAGEDARVREQAMLFDSAPLFVPTAWNSASAIDGVASLEEQAELYGVFPPRLRIDEAEAPTAEIAARFRPPAVDALRDMRMLRGTEGFGKGAEAGYTVPGPRAVRILVEPMAGGAATGEQRLELPDEIATAIPGGLWETPVFFIDAGLTGVVGVPVMARSSGIEELDAGLRRHLAGAEFARRLAAGYYRVTLVP